MSVLESTERAMPRSALRHRPSESDADQGKASITPVAQRASRLKTPQTEEDGQVAPVGASTAPQSKTPRLIRTGARRRGMLRAHPLLLLGLGMILMLVLWTLLTLAVSWWNTTWDDIHYGRPRTFQIDAVVGQNDSPASPSHFIALNLNGRIEVIDLVGLIFVATGMLLSRRLSLPNSVCVAHMSSLVLATKTTNSLAKEPPCQSSNKGDFDNETHKGFDRRSN